MGQQINNEISKKILVLDAGEAPYSLTVARALGSSGYTVDLGFQYGAQVFDAYSKFCKNYLFYPDPSFFSEDFKARLGELAGKYAFVIPTMEKTQLCISQIKDYLENKGTTVPCPSIGVLSAATDKAKMIQRCSDLQIDVPKTITPTVLPRIQDLKEQLGFPFIIKTSTEINIPVGPNRRYVLVNQMISQEELEQRYNQIALFGQPIIQEYVKGTGVGASFIFSRKSTLISCFGHRRILERFPQGGPSIIAETFFHPKAVIEGYKLLKSLGWQGVAMTEFKLSPDGKLYFMEVNPRFWGTLPLAIASDINFPRLLIENYNSVVNSTIPIKFKNKIMFRMLTAYVFVEALKEGDATFARKIVRSSLRSLDRGLFFIADMEKLDVLPSVKKVIKEFNAVMSRVGTANIGNVYFGPYRSPEEISKLGIHCIIDLRCESEKSRKKIPGNVTIQDYPISDDSAPDIDSLIELTTSVQEIAAKEPVYIHCRLGRGRAPMVVLSYLVSTGMPLSTAYSIVYAVRPYAHLNAIQKKAVYLVYKYYAGTARKENNRKMVNCFPSTLQQFSLN